MASSWRLLLTVQMLSLQQPVASPTAGFDGRSDYLDQISYSIIIGQLKQRMLLGMNRSEPPQVDTVRRYIPDVPFNVPRLLLLSSPAGDFQRQDLISFKLDSCLSSHVQEIEKALLVFRVRSFQRGYHSDVRIKHSESVGGYHSDVRIKHSESVRGKTRNLTLQKKTSHNRRQTWWGRRNMVENDTVTNLQALTGNNHLSSRSFHFSKYNSIYNLTGGNHSVQRDNEMHEKASFPLVKIVVRVMNMTTDRKRNIALQEIEVKTTTAVLVSVPMKYLGRAARDSNHTLTLQIVCRRCGQRMWVESVYKSRRRHGSKYDWKHDKSNFLSPNRPYLHLDMRKSTCSDQSRNYLQDNYFHSTILETVMSSVRDGGK